MAVSSYASLASAVASLLDIGYGNISAIADILVKNAENRIFRDVRTPHMETALSGAIAAGVLAVPADYVEMRFAYIDGAPAQPLEMRPVSFIYERYPTGGDTGKPSFMARDGSNFIFGPAPDSGYTVKGTYYKRLDSVIASPTAFFLANTDLYLMASMLETELALGRDKRFPIWEAKYRELRESINREAERSRYSGPISMM